VAQTRIPGLRRYEVSRVFRKASGRVPPHQFFQADLDLVGPATCPALGEAEALKVVAEVVSAFPHWDLCQSGSEAETTGTSWGRSGSTVG